MTTLSKMLNSASRGASVVAVALVVGQAVNEASAGSLEDKVKAGEPIRIGYSIDPPYATTTPSGIPRAA